MPTGAQMGAELLSFRQGLIRVPEMQGLSSRSAMGRERTVARGREADIDRKPPLDDWSVEAAIRRGAWT